MAAPNLRVLVNPAAGRGSGAEHLDRIRVMASKLDAGLVVSRRASDLVEGAKAAVRDGVERLLVFGGDGTMHLAAQGLVGSDTALAVVPLGTGNDLARALGVPRKMEAAVEAATRAPVRRIDLVRVGEVHCIGYAGVGFDSEVAGCSNRVRKLRGPLVYVYALVKTLISFVPPGMRVVHDEGVFEGRVMFAVANNLPSFGGGMKIAPEAKIDDGLIDLVIVRQIPKLTLLRIFPKVYSGKHLGHAACLLVKTRKVEITIDREMTLFGGGEPLQPMEPGVPVKMEIVPAALAVVSPLTPP
jgi:diacylglycerol kinase (ATP)